MEANVLIIALILYKMIFEGDHSIIISVELLLVLLALKANIQPCIIEHIQQTTLPTTRKSQNTLASSSIKASKIPSNSS